MAEGDKRYMRRSHLGPGCHVFINLKVKILSSLKEFAGF